jgi:hypothetical protein
VHSSLDPDDVSWVEQKQTDENDTVGITEVSFIVRKPSTQSEGDFDMEVSFLASNHAVFLIQYNA